MKSVLSYSGAKQVFDLAKRHKFALPAINISNTNTINAVLEAAAAVNSPVIIQFSNKGSHFFAGNSLGNLHQEASIKGAVAAAHYVHALADSYGVRVILNTDHAAEKLLPWVDGMMEAGRPFFDAHGFPLFTSHMIDLSELPLEKNIEISKRYLEKIAAMDMYLEIELGITGGEEDGVDNAHVRNELLYTRPEEVAYAYEELRKISDHFVIAAAFGNVHGVYQPGNVKLEPAILRDSQQYIMDKFRTAQNPVNLVFHGGSGSPTDKIREAIEYGVVKVNMDTDMQWAFWDGIRQYYTTNAAYLQSQLGNNNDAAAPNKKFYDPRTWLREAEGSLKRKVIGVFEDLNAVGVNKLLTGVF